AEQLTAERPSGVLHALVHLDDAGLWRMLKAEAIARPAHGAVRTEYFNVFETGARMLLDERPPFALTRAWESPRRPHVLIAGLDGIGDALVRGVAHLWQNSGPAPDEELRLTIMSEDADSDRVRLLSRYP